MATLDFMAGDTITPTLYRVQRLLERVSYRAGWTFTAHECPFDADGRPWIHIDGAVPDAHGPRLTRINVRAVVPNFFAPNEFYRWLADRLIYIERHESREFFWVEGRVFDSPHRDERQQARRGDYVVRKSRGGWSIHNRDGVRLDWRPTWRQAYVNAWERVVADNLAKETAIKTGVAV